jgi:endo-1,4-beta-xylanase
MSEIAMGLSRRNFLLASSSLALSACTPTTSKEILRMSEEIIEAKASLETTASLMRKFDLDIGCAVPWNYSKPEGFWPVVEEHFSLICPEYQLNWSEDTRYSQSTELILDARKRGKKVRGHTLYYYQNLPNFVYFPQWQTATASDAGDLLQTKAEERVKRWGKDVSYWVINEAIDSKRGTGMRLDPVTRKLGLDTFRLLIEAVKSVDPTTEIEMNDFVIERKGSHASNFFLEVAEHLDKHNLKFDRVGFQCHIDWRPEKDFSTSAILSSVKKLEQINVDIAISEIDVDDRQFRGTPEQRDLFVADEIYKALSELKDIPRLKEVTTWSAFDETNWIRKGSKDNLSFQRSDMSRCGWFDESMQPKLAYYAMVRALSGRTASS